MKHSDKDLQEILKGLPGASKTDLDASFQSLTDYLSELHPLKLLTQLMLTFLTIPEGKFVAEGDDVHQWLRWTEFVAGYMLSRPYPVAPETHIDGRQLEQVEKRLDEYFRYVSRYLMAQHPGSDEPENLECMLQSAKWYSLYVRGETYPHHLFGMAEDLYAEHDEWFRRKLGFTATEAMHISRMLLEENNEKINKEKKKAQKAAKVFVDGLISGGECDEAGRDDAGVRAFGALYFGRSDEVLSFTLDDIVRVSGCSEETCKKYLARMSQQFGYRNPKFPDVFEDSLAAPWDYNTLYERPIISHDNKYWVLLPAVFPAVLFNTFYYDLLGDPEYGDIWSQKYGRWLEVKTAECLEHIFPTDEIFLNPLYPNGEELADILILHDRKIFIIQCKTKRLRLEAYIGKDGKALKSDLEKSVRDAFDQAVHARDYLHKEQTAELRTKKGRLVIDITQVTDTFLISVTTGGFQNFTTRLANINSELELFAENEYPWAVSLFDLMVIAELIDYPSMFIHYLKRRLKVEHTPFHVLADEMDLLGFYFCQGLWFTSDEFKDMNLVSVTGYSYDADIDQYMFKKYECGENPSKPGVEMPPGFASYLASMEELTSPYKTDCAVHLLDLSGKGKEAFVKAAGQIRKQAQKNGKLQSFSTVVGDGGVGFSFVAMDAHGDPDTLFQQVVSYAAIKKYTMKRKDWVAIGWDRSTDREVDVAVFLSFEWSPDEGVEKIAEEQLRKGKQVDIKSFIGEGPNEDSC